MVVVYQGLLADKVKSENELMMILGVILGKLASEQTRYSPQQELQADKFAVA